MSTTVASGGGAAHEGDPIDVVDGRVSAPFVMVPRWIVFGASAKARALYEAISAHRDWWAGGDRAEKATLPVLAELIGVSDSKAVRRYVRELEALGAIDVVRRRTVDGMNAPNVYVIHTEPPYGFTGPRTLREYYAHIGETGKTAGRPVGVSTPPRSKQEKPDKQPTQNRGKADKNRESAGRPVGVSGPLRGGVETPPVGVSGPPISRSSFKKNPPSPRTDPAPPAPVEVEGGGIDDETKNAARALLAALPSPVAIGSQAVRALTDVTAAALASGWSAEALTAHLTADLPARVQRPRGLLERRLSDLPAPPAGAEAAPVLADHCGDSRCRNGLLEHEDTGMPVGRCPSWPHAAATGDEGARA